MSAIVASTSWKLCESRSCCAASGRTIAVTRRVSRKTDRKARTRVIAVLRGDVSRWLALCVQRRASSGALEIESRKGLLMAKKACKPVRGVYPLAQSIARATTTAEYRRGMTMTRSRFISIMVVSACVMCLPRPAAAQGVGAIAGTVTDASGAVLPGATVTLSNPRGSIGGNQETVADARGAFQFIRLVPGTYTVKGELEGFRSAVQENVIVNADVTARVDMKMEIGTLQEGITVKGESPLLDTTSALKQTVLSREVLDALPNRIDVWSVARVIPSVVLSKVDVGGSESFLQSTATLHGSNNENGFLIDGMDVSNLDGNGTGAVMYLDPYAFQETNYQTSGGGTAISSKGGLLFNMVTRTGTNQFHGGAMFNGANHGMGSANYSDELRAQLLAGIPDVVRAANPNIVPGADILKIYDVGAWVAGPIVRDKLWFSFSAHDQALDQYLLGNYNPDGTQVLDDNLMWTTATKVAWQMNRSAQLSYFNNLQYKLIGHRNGGGTFAESRARNLNDKYPDVHQVKFTSPIGSRLVVDVSYNRFRADDMFGQEP